MVKKMKWKFFILLIFTVPFFWGSGVLAAESITAIGGQSGHVHSGTTVFSAFDLPMPEGESDKNYLGLSGTGTFSVGQIKAPVLLIEVFSFYCPICQKTAAHVNDLYQMIQQDPDLKDNIRMIGLGVTNTAYEVNTYRERYKVPFPLFPDKSMAITQQLDVRGTPTFIGVKRSGEGSQQRFFFSEGGFDDTQKLLDEIVKLSGLKKEAKP